MIRTHRWRVEQFMTDIAPRQAEDLPEAQTYDTVSLGTNGLNLPPPSDVGEIYKKTMTVTIGLRRVPDKVVGLDRATDRSIGTPKGKIEPPVNGDLHKEIWMTAVSVRFGI